MEYESPYVPVGWSPIPIAFSGKPAGVLTSTIGWETTWRSTIGWDLIKAFELFPIAGKTLDDP
jgi:hypothetical protein